MSEESLVRNAADEKQVGEAAKKEKRGREREIEDLKKVLSTPEGRAVFWRLLEHCGVYRSTYDDLAQRNAYLSGIQDVGHFIQSEIVATDERFLAKMSEENRKK